MTYPDRTRQTRLICSRIDAGYRLAEVAEQFGISRQRVHQIYVKTMGRGVPTREPIVRDGSSARLRKFWASFRVADSGCWEWTGRADPSGYGRVSATYTHRAAFALVKGPIPSGLTIDHLCRNRIGTKAGRQAPETCPDLRECPGHRGAETYDEAMAAGKDGRWLGSLARSATIEVDAYSSDLAEGVAELWWGEALPAQDAKDEGCNCCGQPHSFYARPKVEAVPA